MAFYYTLMRGWVLFGDSEPWLLSLSALFGVLAIPAVYLLGKRFMSWKVGLIAAALLAVHSSHLRYSEQLRSYSLWVLLVVVSTYCFLALIENPNRKSLWVLYIVLALLVIYTQVFGIFLLAAQWLSVIPQIKRLGLGKILLTFAAIGILSAPMAFVMVTENKGQLDWVPRLSMGGMWEVFRNLVGTDVLGSHDLFAIVVLTALYVIAWIFALSVLFRAPNDLGGEPGSKQVITVLAWSLIFPFVAMTAISFAKPVLYPRYLLMSVPAAVLLAGQGLVMIGRQGSRGRIVLPAALAAMLALAFLGVHRFDSEIGDSGNDYRGLSNYILEHKQPGDAVILYNFAGGWAFDYYTRRYSELGGQGAAPTILFPLTFERNSLIHRTDPYRRVWVALAQEIPTPDSIANYELLHTTLGQGRFHLAEQKEFLGTTMFPGEDVAIHLSLYSSVPQ